MQHIKTAILNPRSETAEKGLSLTSTECLTDPIGIEGVIKAARNSSSKKHLPQNNGKFIMYMAPKDVAILRI